MNNIFEILNNKLAFGVKNINKLIGNCENYGCFCAYYNKLFICKRCNSFACHDCIKLDREKCAKCEYELKFGKTFAECEICGDDMVSKICDYCENLKRFCGGECFWNYADYWGNDEITRCRVCKKN